MPAYYPEGDYMRSQDDNHRSLHKMIANFGSLFGGNFVTNDAETLILVADDGTTYVTED